MGPLGSIQFIFKMEENTQFRDVFNENALTNLAKRIKAVYPEFDSKSFVKSVAPYFAPLGLLERANLITEALKTYMPDDYPRTVSIMLDALDEELETADFSGDAAWMVVPQSNFVAKYGLEHYDISMNALYEMTKRFSSEWAIRAYITNFPEKTIPILHQWAQDDNFHIRRLASEGSRTRLPWGTRLPQFIEDPKPVLEILERLKADSELYVRRSVANNLNDISKDHSELVVKTLQRWKKDQNDDTNWIIGHALRSLVKLGNKDALELLGYPSKPKLELNNFTISNDPLPMGGSQLISFELHSSASEDQNLMVDYIVHYMKANGKQAPKVFKLAKKTIKAGEKLAITKKQPFKTVSTRKVYPGLHSIELQVNGNSLGKLDFELLEN